MYTPLNSSLGEIRLLSLLPGAGDSPIKGIIYTSTIHPDFAQWIVGIRQQVATRSADGIEETIIKQPNDGVTQYEALSYEWGDPEGIKHTIVINDQPFEVRENLFQALTCFRHGGLMGPLWIDAICIDQKDNFERNEQVRMMDVIYRFASKVRVWLGCDTAEISGAFQLMREIMGAGKELDAMDLEERWQAYDSWGPSVSRFGEYLLQASSEEFFISDWGGQFATQDEEDIWSRGYMMDALLKKEWWYALLAFLQHSYWTRLWIVQEYVLAKEITIHCGGGGTIDFLELNMAFNSIVQLKCDHPSCPKYLEKVVESIRASTGMRIIRMRREKDKRNLADVIETTKASKCHDPRDRIYAILAFADDMSDFRESFPINYNRPISKVKMDIVWFILQSGKFAPGYISRICSLLDEIYADYPDEE